MDNQYKIFYSWQSDLPNNTNRGLIQDALDKALRRIKRIAKIEADRDTMNVAGSPEIHDTIFEKISQADFHLADISLINISRNFIIKKLTKKQRPSPNPNVLVELGYALSKLGENRIILVFNSAIGAVEDLPFDINKKRVLTYNSSSKTKSEVKAQLAERLEDAIIAMIEQYEEQKSKSSILVDFFFGNKSDRKVIGKNLSINSKINLILTSKLPEYSTSKNYNSFIMEALNHKTPNKKYYEDYFASIRAHLLYEKISFYIKNNSLSNISNVHIELRVPRSNGVDVIEELPEDPKQEIDTWHNNINSLSGIMARNRNFEKLTKYEDYYLLEFTRENIQPSKDLFFDTEYYIAADESCNIEISVKIIANELKHPIEDKMLINIGVERKLISAEEFFDVLHSKNK